MSPSPSAGRDLRPRWVDLVVSRCDDGHRRGARPDRRGLWTNRSHARGASSRGLSPAHGRSVTIQRALAAQVESTSDAFAELERWIAENLTADLRVERLAERAGDPATLHAATPRRANALLLARWKPSGSTPPPWALGHRDLLWESSRDDVVGNRHSACKRNRDRAALSRFLRELAVARHRYLPASRPRRGGVRTEFGLRGPSRR